MKGLVSFTAKGKIYSFLTISVEWHRQLGHFTLMGCYCVKSDLH